MFITAGMNSPFTACVTFCQSKTQLPNTVSSSCRAQFVCAPPSLFVLLPLSSSSSLLSLISSSAPPLWRHRGEKASESKMGESRWDRMVQQPEGGRKAAEISPSWRKYPRETGLQRPSSFNVRFHLYKYYNKTAPLLTSTFPSSPIEMRQSKSRRGLAQPCALLALSLLLGAALLGSFSAQLRHHLSVCQMAPHQGPSCGLWLPFPAVPCLCRDDSSPCILSQLSALLQGPASHSLQQIQQFLPLPSMKDDTLHLAHNNPEETPAAQPPAAWHVPWEWL